MLYAIYKTYHHYIYDLVMFIELAVDENSIRNFSKSSHNGREYEYDSWSIMGVKIWRTIYMRRKNSP